VKQLKGKVFIGAGFVALLLALLFAQNVLENKAAV